MFKFFVKFSNPLIDGHFAGVTEGWVTKVMRKADALGQVFIQAQCTGDVSADAGHLERVRESRTVVVASTAHEHLCFALEATKRFGMDDTASVSLKPKPSGSLLFRMRSAEPGTVLDGERCKKSIRSRYSFVE